MQKTNFFVAAVISLGMLWPVVLSADECARQDTLRSAKVSADRDRSAGSAVPLQAVSSSELQRRGVATLTEALRSFSGVNVKDYGGIGGLKTVSVRGLGAHHTAVIYDGITISDAQNGMVDIGRFNIENLGSVSMSIAGEEDIFRSARQMNSAGALVLQSRKPGFSQSGTHATAQLRAGSFGTVNPYLHIAQRISERWSAGVSANYLRSDGSYPFTLVNGKLVTQETRLNSDVQSISSEANVYGDIAGGEFRLKASWFGSERGLPGSVVLYTQDPTERLWDRSFSTHAVYEREIGIWRYRAGLGYDWSWNRYVNTSKLYPESLDDIYSQKEYSASGIVQVQLSERLKLVLAQDLFVNTLDSDIPDFPFPSRLSSVTALSASYLTGRFSLMAGLSAYLSHESISSPTPALPEAAPDRHRLSPSISASYMLREGLRVRASWRDGYRVPSFNDLYYARIGNRSLRPEKASQFNLGLTWSRTPAWGSFSLSADAYYNYVKDKIYAIPTLFIWKMHNVGSASITGSDLSAKALVNASNWLKLRMSAGYSWQHAIDVTDPRAKNYRHQIPYTPEHSGNASLVFETVWFNLGYTLNASGCRYALPQNTASSRISGYADHALSLNRELELGRIRMLLSAEALNLGGRNYELVQYYPMPGRHYRITIKITY